MKDDTQLQPKDEVTALARGLALLRAVSQANRPLSNRELVEATGIPKATISRLAATLVGAGYLRQLPDSERFCLGASLLDLANAYLRNFDLRSHARLHLADLAEFAGAAVHLGVRDDLHIVLIDAIRPHSAVILSRFDVGSRLEMASSAAGRAWVASLDEHERRPLLERLRAASPNWRATKRQLDAAQDEYRQLGYCTSFGDWHHDIHAIAVVLDGPRDERYAISCGGPAYLLTRELLSERIAPKLLETARAIAKEAGTPAPR